MKYVTKRILSTITGLAFLLQSVIAAASGFPFQPNQVLNAADLNNALTTAHITSGSLDSVTVTNSTISSTIGTFLSLTSPSVSISGGLMDGVAIGTANPKAGTFTTVTAVSGVFGPLSTTGALSASSVSVSNGLTVGGTVTASAVSVTNGLTASTVAAAGLSVSGAVTSGLTVTGVTSGTFPNYSLVGNWAASSAVTNAGIGLASARGTLAAPTATKNGDIFGNLDAWGYNGSAYAYSGSIDFMAGGDFSGSSYPSMLMFNLTSAGSSSPVNTASLTTSGLTVSGTVSAPTVAASTVNASGTVTASAVTATNGAFSGAGTGLTGTAPSLLVASASMVVSTAFSKMPPITVSVVSNSMTASIGSLLSPSTYLDFRSATAASGTPSSGITWSPLSIPQVIVPASATLGTVSGNTEHLMLLALNNAGTVELGIVNLSGGLDLDEEDVISTTAISSSSNASNVVYSTNARTNVPYRVVGAIEISEATAGAWATGPINIVGVGAGNPYMSLQSAGYGQTWQTFTSVTRAIGTTYYNQTNRPITVLASVTTTAPTVVVGGVTIIPGGVIAGATPISFMVPPGQSYAITTGTWAMWSELR